MISLFKTEVDWSRKGLGRTREAVEYAISPMSSVRLRRLTLIIGKRCFHSSSTPKVLNSNRLVPAGKTAPTGTDLIDPAHVALVRTGA